MGIISITNIVTTLFVLYLSHSMYQLFKLFTPELCSSESENCRSPLYEPSTDGKFPLMQLRVYTATGSRFLGPLAYKNNNFQLNEAAQFKINVSLPQATRNNGSLYTVCYLLPHNFNGENPENDALWSVPQSSVLTVYQIPEADTFKLISDEEKSVDKNIESKRKSNSKPVAHIRTTIPLTASYEAPHLDAEKIPSEIRYLLSWQKNSKRSTYLPLFYLDDLSFRTRDLVQVKPSMEKLEITVDYRPSSFGKLRLLIAISGSMKQLKLMGFTDKDIDEVKGIFVDSNLYLLGLTFFVSSIHLLFDCLSFKNDISFWRNRKTMVGLSTKALLWRCFSYTIIFFYLLDQNTSYLVLIPSFVSVLIEFWKFKKALKISFSFSGGFTFGDQSVAEKQTDEFDTEAMKYLGWLMLPLCIIGAVYSLLYVPHKSWYSWFVQSLVNGVYAFGFLFMLPQLFLNYKLKSVAHLPWRAFMYKAFNTFIDDIFAFIITMPTAHRVACFRDDIVFLIYLYQRYLYPVDNTRVNEHGETGEDYISEEQKEKAD